MGDSGFNPDSGETGGSRARDGGEGFTSPPVSASLAERLSDIVLPALQRDDAVGHARLREIAAIFLAATQLSESAPFDSAGSRNISRSAPVSRAPSGLLETASPTLGASMSERSFAQVTASPSRESPVTPGRVYPGRAIRQVLPPHGGMTLVDYQTHVHNGMTRLLLNVGLPVLSVLGLRSEDLARLESLLTTDSIPFRRRTSDPLRVLLELGLIERVHIAGLSDQLVFEASYDADPFAGFLPEMLFFLEEMRAFSGFPVSSLLLPGDFVVTLNFDRRRSSFRCPCDHLRGQLQKKLSERIRDDPLWISDPSNSRTPHVHIYECSICPDHPHFSGGVFRWHPRFATVRLVVDWGGRGAPPRVGPNRARLPGNVVVFLFITHLNEMNIGVVSTIFPDDQQGLVSRSGTDPWAVLRLLARRHLNRLPQAQVLAPRLGVSFAPVPGSSLTAPRGPATVAIGNFPIAPVAPLVASQVEDIASGDSSSLRQRLPVLTEAVEQAHRISPGMSSLLTTMDPGSENYRERVTTPGGSSSDGETRPSLQNPED